MQTKAQRVSRKKDNNTWCLPNKGYALNPVISVDLDEYAEHETIEGDISECDESWPKGAAMDKYVKIGNRIYKKRDKE